eukprot:TRINITY_DN9743_c0_g1_i1.p1 TRINITY_DN9743_c0_g1~~TRINITY_DN9743_c0_g1_i1.p1  ORF type:complete len:518 (-),score=58.83 TRINITY_DN9743_c0_g1_i1:2-1519(-)
MFGSPMCWFGVRTLISHTTKSSGSLRIPILGSRLLGACATSTSFGRSRLEVSRVAWFSTEQLAQTKDEHTSKSAEGTYRVRTKPPTLLEEFSVETPVVVQRLRRLLEQGLLTDVEAWIKKLANPSPKYYHVVVQDLVQRNKNEEALQFISRLLQDNRHLFADTWKLVIRAFCEQGNEDVALETANAYLTGKRNALHSKEPFHPIFDMYASKGDYQKCDDLIRAMMQFGIDPDNYTYMQFVAAYVKSHPNESVAQTIEGLKNRGMSLAHLCDALIRLHSYNLNYEKAYQVLQIMIHKDISRTGKTYYPILRLLQEEIVYRRGTLVLSEEHKALTGASSIQQEFWLLVQKMRKDLGEPAPGATFDPVTLVVLHQTKDMPKEEQCQHLKSLIEQVTAMRKYSSQSVSDQLVRKCHKEQLHQQVVRYYEAFKNYGKLRRRVYCFAADSYAHLGKGEAALNTIELITNYPHLRPFTATFDILTQLFTKQNNTELLQRLELYKSKYNVNRS